MRHLVISVLISLDQELSENIWVYGLRHHIKVISGSRFLAPMDRHQDTDKGVLRGPRGPKKFAFRSFLLSIVEHTLSLYDNTPSHELRDYCARVGDEELTHVYPNFPL